MWDITDSRTDMIEREVFQEESRSSSTAQTKRAAERIQSTYRRSSGRSMIARFLLRLYRTEKNNRSDPVPPGVLKKQDSCLKSSENSFLVRGMFMVFLALASFFVVSHIL